MNFIFTGCSGAGKTTLINHLANLGYCCHQEVSRQVIKEQVRQKTSAVPWKNTAKFCHLTFQKMIETLPYNSNDLCFSDRGLPDIIAYLQAFQYPVPPLYYDVLKGMNYASVAFLFPPSKAIYVNDNERQETFEEALFFFQAIKKTYQLLGFTLCTIPLMPLDLRAQYLLDSVHRIHSS